MSPGAFGITIVSIAGLLVIAAFVKFFADDHKRAEATRIKQQNLEQSYRDKLGDLAAIDESHMTSDVEARMTGAQKEQWLALQAFKAQYAMDEKLSLDLFGPATLAQKLKQLAKLLGIVAAFGLFCLIFSDSGSMQVFLGCLFIIYVLFIKIRSRINVQQRDKKDGQLQ